MPKEQYQPSAQEVKKAEDSMWPGQKKQVEFREHVRGVSDVELQRLLQQEKVALREREEAEGINSGIDIEWAVEAIEAEIARRKDIKK